MRESPRLREIRRLDPLRDAERLVYFQACLEFPFDLTRSLELAFFRTFAVPTIAERLDSTGEFVERSRKRYDDTDLLISTFTEHGYSTASGRAAIRRMNQLHGRFPIANDDFLYILSTMVLEPFRWNERFGWRPALPTERLGMFHLWRAVGRLMNINDIPETYEELERFNRAFERNRFARTEAGHAWPRRWWRCSSARSPTCRSASAPARSTRSSTRRCSMPSGSPDRPRQSAGRSRARSGCERGRWLFSHRAGSRVCARGSRGAPTRAAIGWRSWGRRRARRGAGLRRRVWG